MRVKVKFLLPFDDMSSKETVMDLEKGADVRALIEKLSCKFPEKEAKNKLMIDEELKVMVLINKRPGNMKTELAHGDEVVFCPVFSGGNCHD